MAEKTLVYILGCGRSGTTILGFCLGNGAQALDLGEVIDYARLRGRPKSFKPGTENFEFWRNVLERVEEDPRWIGFEDFEKYQRRYDRHLATLILPGFTWLLNPFGLRDYRDALECLFEHIMQVDAAQVFVDGSKYPSRLLHLLKIFGTKQIKVVHLVRDAANVSRAFRKEEQSVKRGTLYALAYFTTVNLLSRLVLHNVPKSHQTQVCYERLAAFPEFELLRIAQHLDLDLSDVIRDVTTRNPLRRGVPLNGNRMRMKDQIVFNSDPVKLASVSAGYRPAIWLLRKIFRLNYDQPMG